MPSNSPKKDSVVKNAAIVGSWTGVSRILGLVREMLTSRIFGTSALQSAFVFAFMIPNLFRKLFGEGALSSAFIPAFTQSLKNETREESETFAKRMLTLLGLVLSGIVIIGIIGLFIAEPFLPLGFKYSAAFPLIRIMLPYAPIICMTAITMGILNSLKEFKAPAATTSLLNIVWIAVLIVLFFLPNLSDETKIKTVSWSVLLAGVLQFAYLWIVLKRKGWIILPDFNFKTDPRIKNVCLITIPIALAGAVTQVNLMVDNLFAMNAATWANASISYAERIVYLPLGIIGTAYSTVLLPVFSRQFAEHDSESMQKTLNSALTGIIIPMIPAAIGVVALSESITDVIYRGGAFNEESTRHVMTALACYSIGLPFFGLQKSLTQFFFGRHDKNTPIRISMICVAINFCLNLTFFLTFPAEYKHAGIALATSISAIISTCMFFIAMHRTTDIRPAYRSLSRTFITTLISALVMGTAAHIVWRLLDTRFAPENMITRGLVLGCAVLTGVVIFAVILGLLNKDALKKLLRRGKAR